MESIFPSERLIRRAGRGAKVKLAPRAPRNIECKFIRPSSSSRASEGNKKNEFPRPFSFSRSLVPPVAPAAPETNCSICGPAAERMASSGVSAVYVSVLSLSLALSVRFIPYIRRYSTPSVQRVEHGPLVNLASFITTLSRAASLLSSGSRWIMSIYRRRRGRGRNTCPESGTAGLFVIFIIFHDYSLASAPAPALLALINL